MSANSNKRQLDQAQGTARAETRRRQDAEAALHSAVREYEARKFELLLAQFNAAKRREEQAIAALQTLKNRLGVR
jgi:hypothetical protein